MGERSILNLRIIWGALIFGPLMTLIVLNQVPQQQPPAPLHPTVDIICMAMLIVLVPVGFLVRSIFLRRPRAEAAPSLNALVVGNVIFWSVCEGTCFTSMIVAFISSWTLPLKLCVAAALLLQFLSFPRQPQIA